MWFFSKNKSVSNRYKRKNSRRTSPVYTVRAKASQRRGEQMHRFGIVVMALVALGGTGFMVFKGSGLILRSFFSGNERFTVRDVVTASTGRLTSGHIKEYGRFTEGQNLFELDLGQIRRRLEEVPMIRDVRLQRRLPSTLVVEISERSPLARMPSSQPDFFFSVDREGHVLGMAGTVLRHLPLIRGISDRGVAPGSRLADAGAVDALALISLCDGSPAGQVVRIQTVDVSHADYLDVTLATGVNVLFPRQTTPRKLDTLVAILTESGGRRKFVDMTLDRNIPTL